MGQQQLPDSLWDLKETAKWARNSAEKKAAIRTLSARGEEALASLQEVLAVTAYDEIKSTCEEAIRSVKDKTNSWAGKDKSIIISSNNDSSEKSSSLDAAKKDEVSTAGISSTAPAASAADSSSTGKSSRKNGNTGDSGSSSDTRNRLADLPP